MLRKVKQVTRDLLYHVCDMHVGSFVFFFFSKRIMTALTPRIPSLGSRFEVAKYCLCFVLEKHKNQRLQLLCIVLFVFFFFSMRILTFLTPRIPSLGGPFEVAKYCLCFALEKHKNQRLQLLCIVCVFFGLFLCVCFSYFLKEP